jgi:glutamate-1-semialdehyde 2,1-aminomutase
MSSRYEKLINRSLSLYNRARKRIPGGVAYSVRYFEPFPVYAKYAKGSRIYDVDGREYVDMWMGHGAIIMGHSYPPVIREAVAQIKEGPHIGFSTEWEIKHAEQISKMIPCAEMVKPTNSGTEANMYAIRLARAYTGRRKIVKFEGHWHGGYDALQKGTNFPYDKPSSSGLHDSLMEDTIVAPFNDVEGLRQRVKGIEEDIACYIIEPVPAAGGFIPSERDFLSTLREICNKYNSILIFDEVVTGFRISPGGAQQYYRIEPDLTILGKIVGGSVFPAGALCGVKEIMERTDHTKYRNESRVFVGGTYSGNPLTARAGYTLLKKLDTGRESIYPYLERLGEKARKGIEKILSEKSFPAHVTGIGSLFCIHFTPVKPKDVSLSQKTKDKELSKLLHRYLTSRGYLFLTPETPHFILSYAHTEKDVDRFVEHVSDFIEEHAGPLRKKKHNIQK